jgi:hypothetical protein
MGACASYTLTGGEIAAGGVHENPRAPSAPSPARPAHLRRGGSHAGAVGLAGGGGSARLGNRAGRCQLQRSRILRGTGCAVTGDQRRRLQRWRVHPGGCHLGSWRGFERAGGCSLSGLWRPCGWGLDRPARRGQAQPPTRCLRSCSRDLLRGTGTRGQAETALRLLLAASVLLSSIRAPGIPPATTSRGQFRSRWAAPAHPMAESQRRPSRRSHRGHRRSAQHWDPSDHILPVVPPRRSFTGT